MVVVGLRQLKNHLHSPQAPDWRGKSDVLRWIEAILKGKRAVLVDRRRQRRRKTDSADGLMTLEEARKIVLSQLEEEEDREPSPEGIKARVVVDDDELLEGC